MSQEYVAAAKIVNVISGYMSGSIVILFQSLEVVSGKPPLKSHQENYRDLSRHLPNVSTDLNTHTQY